MDVTEICKIPIKPTWSEKENRKQGQDIVVAFKVSLYGVREKFINARKKLGLSQVMVAKKIGISSQMVQLHEDCKRGMTVATFVKYCKLYGIDHSDLITPEMINCVLKYHR